MSVMFDVCYSACCSDCLLACWHAEPCQWCCVDTDTNTSDDLQLNWQTLHHVLMLMSMNSIGRTCIPSLLLFGAHTHTLNPSCILQTGSTYLPSHTSPTYILTPPHPPATHTLAHATHQRLIRLRCALVQVSL